MQAHRQRRTVTLTRQSSPNNDIPPPCLTLSRYSGRGQGEGRARKTNTVDSRTLPLRPLQRLTNLPLPYPTMLKRRPWPEELAIIDSTMKAISGVTDPAQLVEIYW